MSAAKPQECPSQVLAGSAGKKSFRAACDYLDMIGCTVHTSIVTFRRNLPPWLSDSKLSPSFVAARCLAGLLPQIALAQHITIDGRLASSQTLVKPNYSIAANLGKHAGRPRPGEKSARPRRIGE